MVSREEFLTKYASHLNEKQLRAIQAVNGPVLLLAVPGSGKTSKVVANTPVAKVKTIPKRNNYSGNNRSE